MSPNLLLIGFMGTGKSSVGRMVATRLRFRFVDTDALIVERTGLAIPDIFAQHGEPHFRELETSVLESCALSRRCVVATGGGIVLREKNRTLLRDLGLVVQLTASPEVIFARVSRHSHRPLLQTPNPADTIAEMLGMREELYATTAHLTFDTSTTPKRELAQAIASAARQAFGW